MLEIVGQDLLKHYVNEAVKNNRVAHSFLLCGPEGIGKSIFALYMAQMLLCTSEKKPCGTCSFCTKIEKQLHADVKIIGEQRKSIGVGDIRKLIDEINTKPYEGDKKIIIIKNADQITTEGQNALLKTLEEPPANVFVFLLVNLIDSLLSTIRSRCQLLRFERVSVNEIKAFLLKRGHNTEEAVLAASLSEGVPGRALMLLDSKFINLRKQTIETAHSIVTADPLLGFELSKFFIDNKDQFDFIMDVLTSWNRDILIFKSIKNGNNILNKDYYDLIVEESQLLSYNRLDRALDAIKDTCDKVRQYANFQLAIEMMLLRFQEV